MRALSGLLVPLPFLTGCLSWLVPGLDNPLPCPQPRELTSAENLAEYDLVQPEGGVDIGGDPKYVAIQSVGFAEDIWAAEAVGQVQPYRASSIGADLGNGGSVLVCSFAVGPTPGIDGIDGPTGPVISTSTPDLLVWADFAGEKVNKGPAFSSSRATFAFRVSLKEGDPVHFGFGDFDVFSANDGIGGIDGRYSGAMPFDVRGRVGNARCHAIPPAVIATERAKWRAELTAASHAFEAYTPTLSAPVSWDLAKRVDSALGAVLYFESREESSEKELVDRLEDASRKQWLRYMDLLRDKRKTSPAAGTWVSVGETWDARVAGLFCRSRGTGIPLCDPALEIRWKQDPVMPDCHGMARFFDALGQVSLVDRRGETTSASMDDARRNGVWARTDAELWQTKKGDTMLVPLSAGGTFWRKNNQGYDIPFVIVNGTYLRIY
ncbi:MAG: hypothetical protein U0441_12595 [Polyangiaceae bacterium]